MSATSSAEELLERLEHAEAELERARAALGEMSKVGMALMDERDPVRLFDLIIAQACTLTGSDGGSLYLVEQDAEGRALLHFIAAQTATLPDVPQPDFELPLDETSIAGYVATTGDPLLLDDVYDLPDGVPFSFNRVFDETYGYRAKSMLAVPMIDHRDHVVGVLQLINRKSDADAKIHTDEDSDRWVLPYTDREVAIVSSLAGQAAVAIENGHLYQSIENLFEGFIKAASTAIDRRDPTTAGHSVRVTELTCDVAALMTASSEGPFADVSFTEAEMKQLRYAGLLHDFGKVAVSEATLVKELKLPPEMGARVEARFELIRRTLEAEAWRAKAEALAAKDGQAEAAVADIDAKLAAELEGVARYREAVLAANVPRVLAEEAADILQEIARRTFVDADGNEVRYLTPEELHYLQIRKGSLDEREREQIQSHVIHSYDFLRDIPWTEDLERIAEIVRGHHEKLDGTGYPDGARGEALSLETKIMTVCDIFDALTASDRPYKKAMPVDKALDILAREAEQGMLDADIVALFTQSRVYERVLGTDWRDL